MNELKRNLHERYILDNGQILDIYRVIYGENEWIEQQKINDREIFHITRHADGSVNKHGETFLELGHKIDFTSSNIESTQTDDKSGLSNFEKIDNQKIPTSMNSTNNADTHEIEDVSKREYLIGSPHEDYETYKSILESEKRYEIGLTANTSDGLIEALKTLGDAKNINSSNENLLDEYFYDKYGHDSYVSNAYPTNNIHNENEGMNIPPAISPENSEQAENKKENENDEDYDYSYGQ